MMADFEFRIEGLDNLIGKVSPELLRGPLNDAMRRSAIHVQREAKLKVTRDTSRLGNSINVRYEGSPVINQAFIGTNVVYGRPVEFGSRPHFPPPTALHGWVRRKLHVPVKQVPAVALLIARKIAKHGTRAQPFLRPAMEESRSDIDTYFADAAREIERAWAQ